MPTERRFIAILDDEPERIAAMRPRLARLCPAYDVAEFDNAPDMVEWLRDRLPETVLICLDHDLGPCRIRHATAFDPGTGRDVADYLSTVSPVCPVLIHTTNSLAAPGMVRVLEESGWTISRVSPYEDLLWIGEVWASEVRRLLRTAQ